MLYGPRHLETSASSPHTRGAQASAQVRGTRQVAPSPADHPGTTRAESILTHLLGDDNIGGRTAASELIPYVLADPIELTDDAVLRPPKIHYANEARLIVETLLPHGRRQPEASDDDATHRLAGRLSQPRRKSEHAASRRDAGDPAERVKLSVHRFTGDPRPPVLTSHPA